MSRIITGVDMGAGEDSTVLTRLSCDEMGTTHVNESVEVAPLTFESVMNTMRELREKFPHKFPPPVASGSLRIPKSAFDEARWSYWGNKIAFLRFMVSIDYGERSPVRLRCDAGMKRRTKKKRAARRKFEVRLHVLRMCGHHDAGARAIARTMLSAPM